MSWVYRGHKFRNEDDEWTLAWQVGYWTPTGSFEVIRTCDTKYDCEDVIHYLNGGSSEVLRSSG
jgi:hypothetical protein